MTKNGSKIVEWDVLSGALVFLLVLVFFQVLQQGTAMSVHDALGGAGRP